MATEYKLSYTAEEINSKLGEIDNLSEEIADKLPKNQGAGNVGKILVVGTDGNLTLTDMPEGGASGDVIGTLDESNNILLTGNLADGTYKLKYEYADGDVEEVGSMVISSIVTYSITKTLSNCTASGSTTINKGGTATITVTANSGYKLPDSITVSGASCTWDKASGKISLSNPTGNVTITVTAEKEINNLLPTAVDASGNDFVGTHANGGDGYEYGYRISRSSGAQTGSGSDDIYCTGFMPVTLDETIYIEGITINTAQLSWNNLVYYDSSKGYITGIVLSEENNGIYLENGVYRIVVKEMTANSSIAFFRFSCGSITDETIVTVKKA